MEAPPTSVLLPTHEWTAACEELVAQLRPNDELLIICDRESDPVTTHVDDAGDQVNLVVAGEPDACSGKANAIAAGMTAATHDRIVWTDDDFHHPDTWLQDLHRAYDRHGPVSEVPFFVGRDVLSVLLEPVYAAGGSLGTHLGDKAWGGAVLFDRSDLDIDAFLTDLRRTVSDDALLSEHLPVTSLPHVRRVPVGGSIRETVERPVRYFDPGGLVLLVVVTTLLAVATVWFPVFGSVGVTILLAGVYTYLGVYRWTVILTVPSLWGHLLLTGYALWRSTFVWAGRRYRWSDPYEVTVLE